jgi:hypothetical protein
MNAIGRQPEAAGKIQLAMLLGCAFIEALTIYAFVAYFVGTPLAQKAIDLGAQAASAAPK